MNKTLSMTVLMCFLLTLCVDIKGKEMFRKNNISNAISNIEKMRSDENIIPSERVMIRERSVAIIKHELSILFSLIKSSSDVNFLHDIVSDDKLFLFSVDFIVAEQNKLDSDFSNRIVNYIIRNSSSNSAIEYATRIIQLNWSADRYPESFQDFIVENLKQNKIKFYSYYILPDNKKQLLYDYYRTQSKKLLKGNRHKSSHAVPLIATILLASDGNMDAVERLNKLVDGIDINNNFDLLYIVAGTTITRNPLLITKICKLLEEDNREKFFGYDSMPKKITIKNEAAASLSLLDNRFPETSFWSDPSIEHINKCVLWLKNNKLDLNIDNKTLIQKIQRTRLNDL